MESKVFADAVRSRKSYGNSVSTCSKASLHIAFGIDENYARYMGVLITSILANTPNSPLIFHIFTPSIREADLQKIASLTEKHSVSFNIYYINTESLQHLPAADHYSTATYYRLLMPSILDGAADRILYLDSDIICLGSLSSLAGLDMKNHPVAAVLDVQRVIDEKTQELQLHGGNYFNAGVLLIDIKKWNESDLGSLILQILNQRNGKLSLQDQDALNIALDEKTALLPPIWNQVYDMGQMTHALTPGTIFLHYTGSVKPWRLSGRHRLSAHYRNFEAQSPWAGSLLLPPANYKEMEIYARLSLKAGDLVTGLTWYIRYFREKFCKR